MANISYLMIISLRNFLTSFMWSSLRNGNVSIFLTRFFELFDCFTGATWYSFVIPFEKSPLITTRFNLPNFFFLAV